MSTETPEFSLIDSVSKTICLRSIEVTEHQTIENKLYTVQKLLQQKTKHFLEKLNQYCQR